MNEVDFRDLVKIEESREEENEWATNYLKSKRDHYRNILNLVDIHLNGPLLEVGSVPCHLTYTIKNSGHKIIGLDIAPQRAQPVIDAGDLDVRQCDVECDRFPVETSSVSGVIFTEVLEHLRINPIWTLKEIKRVLKPQGKVLLTTPNLLSIYKIYHVLKTGRFDDPYKQFSKINTIGHMGHIREYTPKEVELLLQRTGFKIVDEKYANYNREQFETLSLKHKVAACLCKWFPKLDKQQILVARHK